MMTLELPRDWQHVAAGRVNLRALTGRETLAQFFLTPQEHDDWRALNHPQRRTEWLGARVCLKSLVMDRLQISNPHELSVVKDSRGRPWLSTNPQRGDCSLAHSDEYAAAAWTSVPRVRVGIDVEEITPRLHRAAGAFRSPDDAALVRRSELDQLAIWWTLKEAASKSWGQGLGAGLAEIACTETEPGRHRIAHADGRSLLGWHCAFEGFILALCASDPVN